MSRFFLASFLVIASLHAPAARTGQNASPPKPVPPGQPPGNATPASVAPGQPGTPRNATPANATPANTTPIAPPSPDPARAQFTTDAGLLLVQVTPGKEADYEAAIVALQQAFTDSADPEKRRIASTWRVFKAAETDAKANAIYVHVIDRPVVGADYRPSLLLDDLLAGAPPELLAKYRDAMAAPPNKLAMTEVANMAMAPIPKPTNASPAAPSNATPPKPPGR